MVSFSTVASVILAVSTIASVVALGGGLVVYNTKSSFVGGKILAIDANGNLVETSATPNTAASTLELPSITRTSVLTSGAAALNVTVEVMRFGKQRSWTIVTEDGGDTVDATGPIIVDLTNTGVLLPSDLPILSPNLPAWHIVPCGCNFPEASHLHACGLVVGANQTMRIIPNVANLVLAGGTSVAYNLAGFGAYHSGKIVRVATDFSWIVA